MWWLILGIFLALVLIKALTNVYRYFATWHYYSMFKKNPSKMSRYSEPVGNLFETADTERIVLRSDHGDYQRVITREPVSRNLADQNNKRIATDTFENTLGVYSYRIRESFYPTFWLLLPLSILSSMDIDLNPAVKALISAVYWIITSVAAYLLEKFLDSHFPEEWLQAIESIAR